MRPLSYLTGLLMALSACGGGGGSGASSNQGTGGGQVGTVPDFSTTATPVPDNAPTYFLYNSADYIGTQIPVLLAGVMADTQGDLRAVSGAADVTLLPPLITGQRPRLQIAMGGETHVFTFNDSSQEYVDDEGREFRDPGFFTTIEMTEPDGDFFDLLGGLQASPASLPSSAVYTGIASVYLVDQNGGTANSDLERGNGQVALTLNFAAGTFSGDVFDGTIFAGQGNEQQVVISASGAIAGADFAGTSLTATTDASGGTFTISDAELTGTVLENGGLKAVGVYSGDYALSGSGGTLEGALVGDFTGFRN